MSFLPLYIVSAIRYLVGTDYSGPYRTIYRTVYFYGYHFRLFRESLYGLLNRIAIIFSGSDYVGVFALSSLLICGFMFLGMKLNSVNFLYSVLLFMVSGYYFWSFNGVRQSIAMAIFIFAVYYIDEKKPWKYFLLILIAAQFHTTAVIYFPIYFIKKVKLNLRIICFLPLVAYSFSSLFRFLLRWIASNISIFEKYLNLYLNDSLAYDKTTSSAQIYMNFAFLILYIIISFFYDRKQAESSMWINSQCLAFCVLLCANVLPMASRISRYFSVTQILSIPCMTRLIKDKKVRIVVNISIVLCFCLYTFVTFYLLGYHDVFPYRTIFDR